MSVTLPADVVEISILKTQSGKPTKRTKVLDLKRSFSSKIRLGALAICALEEKIPLQVRLVISVS